MKKIIILVALLFAAANLMAEPIGEQRARQIASEFFSQCATRAAGDITLEWAGDNISESSATGNALNSSLMYIYNRGTNGGFVVVAGDSNVAPIIAYSLDSTLDTDNMAEATKAILDAWCCQVASARKAAKPISGTTMRAATRANDAMLYETALWDQSEPYNREAPIIDGSRSLTGCAATAMSILCYYHRWPENGVGTTPSYSYSDGYHTHTIESNTLGRKYDYDNMLMNYKNGYTNTQGNAVAALMKDMGTSLKMMYTPTASSAYADDVVYAFATYFGYSKGIKLAYGNSYTTEEWQNIIRENIRQYGPTFFAGTGEPGGHAFIVDGFDEGDQFHFNFGWSGNGNGYWRLPEIDFYASQSAILYLEPDKNGTSTYRDDIVLIPLYNGDEQVYDGIKSLNTSYSTGSSFQCLLGGFQNNGISTFDGKIKLVLCDKNDTWKQEMFTLPTTLESGYFSYYRPYVTCTINVSLEEGDRLRIYYKSNNATEWQWARSSNRATVNDEVLVKASPEDMADGLSIKYNSGSDTISFTSKHAAHIVVKDASSNEVLDTENITTLSDYSYTNSNSSAIICEFSLGSNPYQLKLKLK